MMQGDEYSLPIEIYDGDVKANGESFTDVEIIIGDLRKTMGKGEVNYNDEVGAFLFPLTQEETLKFGRGSYEAQVRVKMPNGNVVGVQLPLINVEESLSEVIL